MLKLIYFSLIYPKILYGLEVYANTYQTYLHDLMIINNRILRILQKKDRLCHTIDLYSAYNTLPIDKLFNLKALLYAHAQIYRPMTLPKIIQEKMMLNNQIHQHQTRSSSNFHRSSYNSTRGSKSFSNISAVLWNSLENNVKSVSSDISFKKIIIQQQRNNI